MFQGGCFVLLDQSVQHQCPIVYSGFTYFVPKQTEIPYSSLSVGAPMLKHRCQPRLTNFQENDRVSTHIAALFTSISSLSSLATKSRATFCTALKFPRSMANGLMKPSSNGDNLSISLMPLRAFSWLRAPMYTLAPLRANWWATWKPRLVGEL